MQVKNLQHAKAEALRFLAAVEAAEHEHARQLQDLKLVKRGKDQGTISKDAWEPYYRPDHLNSPKHSGAVKRASMDLTRSLATLRANKY